MTIAALTIQGSISKLNLVCIEMLSSDPHSLSMHRDVEAMTIGTIPININRVFNILSLLVGSMTVTEM